MASLAESLNRIWRKRGLTAYVLWPLSLIYQTAIVCRRYLYHAGWLKVHRFEVPVVVIGNISVGGTGKTPTVIALAKFLQKEGWKPGIVSRGYGGNTKKMPQTVGPESLPDQVGDEPFLIARRAGCPVVVAPDRPAAVRQLLDENNCDIVISDDGLQHVALYRDIEIAMVDGISGFGNGFCLPAGPLREPVSRLESVDFVVCNGGSGEGHHCVIEGDAAARIQDPDVCVSLEKFRGDGAHAVAAIGNPKRFFDLLRGFGIEIIEHPFPDHHKFTPADLQYGNEGPILMTEKDAVKCERFASENMWYVPVEVKLEASFYTELSKRLNHT
jgi:tetraacyldisaccharide 4'-kinase